MTLRSLARASGLYTFGNVAPKIGAFLLLPIYGHYLSQGEYGALALLGSLTAILVILYHLGLDSALLRLHFDVAGQGRARLYGSATVFTLLLSSALTVALALVLGPFFEQVFAGIEFVPLGVLALAIAFVSSLAYVPSALFRASGQAGRFLAVNFGAFVLSSVVAVVLIVWFGLGAVGVLTGQLIGAGAVFVVALVLNARIGTWRIDRASLEPALRLGLPLVPHALSAWGLRLADRWLIALLIGLPAAAAQAQVGIYAFGYQLGYVVSIIVTSFNSAWSPYFYRVGNGPAGPAIHREMTALVAAGLLALAVAISVLAPEALAIIARPGFAPAADVVPVVAFASVAQGLYVMFVTVVFLVKRTGRLALITAGAAALNIGLNVALIPRLGIMGAAWATLAAYAFFAAATFVYARRLFPMQVDAVRIGALATLAVAAVLLARVVAPEVSIASGVVHAAVAAVFAAVAAWSCVGPIGRLRAATATAGEPM